MKSMILTPVEVADILRVSPMTIYRLAKRGEIPGRKVGRSWRFSQSYLEKWLSGESWEKRFGDFIDKVQRKTDKISTQEVRKEIAKAIAEVRGSA